jgi:hypothetical protein
VEDRSSGVEDSGEENEDKKDKEKGAKRAPNVVDRFL